MKFIGSRSRTAGLETAGSKRQHLARIRESEIKMGSRCEIAAALTEPRAAARVAGDAVHDEWMHEHYVALVARELHQLLALADEARDQVAAPCRTHTQPFEL